MSGDGNDEDPRTARSLDAALAADPAGLSDALLGVLALLSGAGASRWLLHTAGELGLLGKWATPAEVDEAIDRLTPSSLARCDGAGDAATVSMDPATARVVLDRRVRDGTLTALGARARTLLDTGIRSGDDIPDVVQLARGITALNDHLTPHLGPADDELAYDLLDLRGWGLWALSFAPEHAAEAIDLGQPLIADYARAFGPAHQAAWESRRNLGTVYEFAGRHAEAIDAYERLLADQSAALPPGDPEIATTRENLALAHLRAGHLTEAVGLLQHSYTERTRYVSPDHPATLSTRSNLAFAHHLAGRLDVAIPLYEESLRDEALVPPDRAWELVIVRLDLAAAYQSAGRPDEARAVYQAARADPRHDAVQSDPDQSYRTRHPLILEALAALRVEE